MPISSIYQIYKEMHTTHMTGSLNYPMKSMQKASHLQRISSGIKLLVFGARFHGARQTNFRMDKNLHRTVFRLHGTHAEPCKFLNDKQSICNWQAKGNLGGRPRTREKGGSFPPSLPPSFASLAFSRSQNPLHFPFERLPCKVICNRINTVPCERVAQVKNSSVEKPEKFDRTCANGV